MTASTPGQRDLVSCRACGATLGALNRHHDKVTLRPGIALCSEHGGGVGILCPECGEYRLLWSGRAFRDPQAIVKRDKRR